MLLISINQKMKCTGFLISLFILCCTSIIGQESVDFRVYLLGNVAGEEFHADNPDQKVLIDQIEWDNHKSAIVFLGDNLFDSQLTDNLSHQGASREGQSQLFDLLESYKGKVYFIAGSGNTAREEERVGRFLDQEGLYIPDNNCPGPAVKNLTDNIKLIALNSQWWLERHHKQASDCRNQNEFQVIQELKELLDKHDDKFVILAFHHPVIADGRYNGHVSLSEHLLPLPILGSTKPFFKRVFGSTQALTHPDYRHFRNKLLTALKGYKNVIVTSAHENNLQYSYHEENHFVVSGSTSKITPLPSKSDAVFSAAKKGYARLDFMHNGALGLKFIITEADAEKAHPFSKEIIHRPPNSPGYEIDYELAEFERTRSADEQYKKGGMHRFIFGNVYREDWATPITFSSINLSREAGGLRPIKVGGGKASNSLRLENKSGKQFVLRSVRKEVSRMVPEAFRNSLVQNVYQDQIAGSQPYAALAVPPLAEAAGVYHTNPRIVYLPDQKMLGEFNTLFADEIYLFEERPTGDHKDEETIVESKKIISYSKMINKIQSSPDHRIRQDQVLRSRLFDILLGDWDRHDDQWRWASFTETKEGQKKGDKMTYYEPIPRDRDQVFYKFEGLGPSIAKFVIAETKKQQSFKPRINNVKYLGFQSRHFDRSFMNGLSESDWIAMAEELKSLITDEVIDEAIERLPLKIRDLNKDFYKKSLMTRRNDLPEYASDYYRHLSKYVDVVGTDEKELFEVTRREDNTVQISLFRLKKDKVENEILYDRVFKANETKEVRLFGLAGKDRFVVRGSQSKGPLIRIIGGEDDDEIHDDSNRRGPKKGTWVYDSVEGNDFSLGRDAKDKRSGDYPANQYKREEYYFPAPGGLFFFGFNPNDGVNIASSLVISTYGFRKAPFKARHSLNYAYAFGSGKLELGYELELIDALGKIDFNFQADLALPSNVNHYFGLTNEFNFRIEDFREFDDLDYFKYNQRRFFIKPSLQFKSVHNVHDLRIGPYYEFSNLLENKDKFISNPQFSDLDPSNLEDKNYFGLDIDYRINKLDDNINPALGAALRMNTSYNFNASNYDESFLRIKGDLALYNLIWLPRPLVLATKISGGINYGDFSFFQAHYAGFDEGLRAFRQNRFGGKASFIVSNDLRVKLFRVSSNSLPFSFGVIGAYDIGRVWNKNVISDTWHNSFGGGFWFNFLDILPLSFYYLTSDEKESSFIMKTGFGF